MKTESKSETNERVRSGSKFMKNSKKRAVLKRYCNKMQNSTGCKDCLFKDLSVPCFAMDQTNMPLCVNKMYNMLKDYKRK